MIDAPIFHVESLGSTMDEMATRLQAGHVEPWTAIVADYQENGRGRSDRTWQAEPGSALLATVFAPISLEPDRVGLIAIGSGVSVADALAKRGAEVWLKWPNDVLLADRKLAGILIRSRLGETIEASVGIGLNLTAAPPDAIALGEVVPDMPRAIDLLVEIRESMGSIWSDLEAGRFDAICERWNARAAWKDQPVIVPGSEATSGRLIGIDDWGRLRIESDHGERLLAQDEIVRGPMHGGTASYTSG